MESTPVIDRVESKITKWCIWKKEDNSKPLSNSVVHRFSFPQNFCISKCIIYLFCYRVASCFVYPITHGTSFVGFAVFHFHPISFWIEEFLKHSIMLSLFQIYVVTMDSGCLWLNLSVLLVHLFEFSNSIWTARNDWNLRSWKRTLLLFRSRSKPLFFQIWINWNRASFSPWTFC